MPAPPPRSKLAIAGLAAVLILALGAPVVSAAGDPPVASFTVAVAGLDATFTDTSTGEPTEWRWDFGDGATSSDRNPTHHYAPGTYTVKLVARNHHGSDSASHDVTITPPDQLYGLNLYSSLVRYQDPDRTACVATAALIMLNEVAAKGQRGAGFRWTTSTSYTRQSSMLTWARSHDTLAAGTAGTDANGWRNLLNRYGWGSYTDPGTMTYKVFAFSSYGAAVKAAIRAMARFDRPVGILGWAGEHAQVLNGYSVFGQDPATSDAFAVRSVYLTDPLKRDALRNARISDDNFHYGALKYRFRSYRYQDSPYDDPYITGIRTSWRAWYGRWVIVAPVK